MDTVFFTWTQQNNNQISQIPKLSTATKNIQKNHVLMYFLMYLLYGTQEKGWVGLNGNTVLGAKTEPHSRTDSHTSTCIPIHIPQHMHTDSHTSTCIPIHIPQHAYRFLDLTVTSLVYCCRIVASYTFLQGRGAMIVDSTRESYLVTHQLSLFQQGLLQ